jgi:lipoyl(octanoyl) transferase
VKLDRDRAASENRMKTCWVVDLGNIEYGAAWELQRRIVAARKLDAIPDVLLLCEHPHVITLGRNGKLTHLHASHELLHDMDVSFFETDRGGDITYHGPGQLVGYPIVNLAAIRRDVAWYMRSLEEAVIRASAEFGVETRRISGWTGVWADSPAATSGEPAEEAKLAAIGVHLSRWITSHGFAYNVTTDLRYFDLIVPCGIAGRRATSLAQLLGGEISREDVGARIVAQLGEIFDLDMQFREASELEAALQLIPDRQLAVVF